MSLQRFQLDIAARLEASAFFENIPVFIFRLRAALIHVRDHRNRVEPRRLDECELIHCVHPIHPRFAIP